MDKPRFEIINDMKIIFDSLIWSRWKDFKVIKVPIRNWKIPRKYSNRGFESERKDNKRSWWRLDSEYKKPDKGINDRPIAYIR